jgi:SUMO ligase MMS21 Smc5/6 complex component
VDWNKPARFIKKPWLKVLFADLLWEKNIIPTEKNKLKSTDYKTSEQNMYLLNASTVVVALVLLLLWDLRWTLLSLFKKNVNLDLQEVKESTTATNLKYSAFELFSS